MLPDLAQGGSPYHSTGGGSCFPPGRRFFLGDPLCADVTVHVTQAGQSESSGAMKWILQEACDLFSDFPPAVEAMEAQDCWRPSLLSFEPSLLWNETN